MKFTILHYQECTTNPELSYLNWLIAPSSTLQSLCYLKLGNIPFRCKLQDAIQNPEEQLFFVIDLTPYLLCLFTHFSIIAATNAARTIILGYRPGPLILLVFEACSFALISA